MATVRLAAIEAGLNNRPTAHTLVESVLEKTPKLPAGALAEDAPARWRTARQSRPARVAEAITKDEPNTMAAAEAYLTIGTIDASRDRTDDAEKAFEEALRIDQRSLPAALALVRAAPGSRALDKADTYARQAMTIAPRIPATRALMVRVDLARGNTSQRQCGARRTAEGVSQLLRRC